ncbi:MAG: endonuclease [Thermoplasmata archaeon]|nr:MAG: endonuclease [Thermoplasmata archaeon]
MLRLGVQVSIAGNIYRSIERAVSLGCNTMQIFARNPRRIRQGSLKEEDIEIFKQKIAQTNISPLIIHSPYTLNLAADKYSFYKLSIREFIQDLKEAYKLGAKYLVVHVGNYKGKKEKGLIRVAKALKEILTKTPNLETEILLENTTGAGGWLGDKISHYGVILKNISFNKRVGICLDTAHLWGAGYRINTLRGLEDVLEEVEKEVGLKRLKLIHLNDTQEELGTKKDRHYHIGKGKIGRKGISLIINHPFLRKLPFILETPRKSNDDDQQNLANTRNLYKNN